MFSFKELLSSLTPLFTAAIVIVVSPIVKELIPSAVQNYLVSIHGKYFFKPQFTLLIEEERGAGNQIYEAAATYLRSKIDVDSSDLKCLKVRKSPRQQGPTVDMVTGQVVMDSFGDINWLKWKLCEEKSEDVDDRSTYFELSFEKKFKEVMPNSYLPHIICMKHGRGTKGAAPTSDAAGHGDAPGTPLPARSAASCHVDSTCF